MTAPGWIVASGRRRVAAREAGHDVGVLVVLPGRGQAHLAAALADEVGDVLLRRLSGHDHGRRQRLGQDRLGLLHDASRSFAISAGVLRLRKETRKRLGRDQALGVVGPDRVAQPLQVAGRHPVGERLVLRHVHRDHLRVELVDLGLQGGGRRPPCRTARRARRAPTSRTCRCRSSRRSPRARGGRPCPRRSTRRGRPRDRRRRRRRPGPPCPRA